MYDVVVIGGGHAGIEAAAAAIRVGAHVALISLEKDALARLSCNPAMGGTAKGQLVKELDALGGLMSIAADRSGIQFRMLNRSKGPAVWSPRAQVDRDVYTDTIDQLLSERYPSLDIIEDEAIAISTKNGRVDGVVCKGREAPIPTAAAIICSGTFMRGLVHVGEKNWKSGRFTEPSTNGLSSSLRSLGFQLRRFKTGTPPRVIKETVDLSPMEPQHSDEKPWFFSHESTERALPQHPCFRTYTSEGTHKLIRNKIHLSPMYNGSIQSTGPRYCPSIEDKVVRFPDRDRHPLIFEPEGLNHPWLYVNGFSSSLPELTQLEALRSIPGCAEAEIGRPGYAVEYDVVPSRELSRTLETRSTPGLYLAGQICGTSGYEEAAVQGLLAGANAALSVLGKDPLILERNEAYIGVLIDDLVTLDPDEPYRMFTSRAEYRMLLRQDNAEDRLSHKAFKANLISEERFETIGAEISMRNRWVKRLESTKVQRSAVLDNPRDPKRVEPLAQMLKRPELSLPDIISHMDGSLTNDLSLEEETLRAVEIEIVYKGYIDRQQREIDRLKKQELLHLPSAISYFDIKGLSAEGRQRLNEHRPETLGQASRLTGVTSSDLAIVLINVKAHKENG